MSSDKSMLLGWHNIRRHESCRTESGMDTVASPAMEEAWETLCFYLNHTHKYALWKTLPQGCKIWTTHWSSVSRARAGCGGSLAGRLLHQSSPSAPCRGTASAEAAADGERGSSQTECVCGSRAIGNLHRDNLFSIISSGHPVRLCFLLARRDV